MPDKDHKIVRRFLFGIKLRQGLCTLLVIQLFVNFLALLQSQTCRFSVIWHLAFDWQTSLIISHYYVQLRQRSIAISSNVDLTYFANRHAVERTKMDSENVNNLKKCARGIVLILEQRLFSVKRKLVLVNMYRLLLFILMLEIFQYEI